MLAFWRTRLRRLPARHQVADLRGNIRHAENAAALQCGMPRPIANVAGLPSDPTDSDTVTVTAELTDFSGVASAVLYYSTDGGGNWLPRSMGLVAGNTWRGTIPPQQQGTVLFKITASDLFAHTTTSGAYATGCAMPRLLMVGSKYPA